MKKNSIKTELKQYIKDNIDGRYDFSNGSLIRDIDWHDEDLHHELFNEDYYMDLEPYQCEQWLKKHDISVFEGIEFVQDYERENFGVDSVRTYDNAKKLVNMIVYIIGEELIYQEEYHKELI